MTEELHEQYLDTCRKILILLQEFEDKTNMLVYGPEIRVERSSYSSGRYVLNDVSFSMVPDFNSKP